MPEELQLRIHDASASPTLIYLPGMHGDWTLLGPFRAALAGKARLVEVTYPRKPDWTLEDYAIAIEAALIEQDITKGWLIGESFSSQVAWQLVRHYLDRSAEIQAENLFGPLRSSVARTLRSVSAEPHDIELQGLILVGGFVRHPWPWGVVLAYRASTAVPMWLLKKLCALYGVWAKRRACACAEVALEIDDFVARRTIESDRVAVTSRYELIRKNDFRPVARRMYLPVFHLSGGIDPIVPWPLVRPWLRRNCPGFRKSRIIWEAGHNVLLSAAETSVAEILSWITAAPNP